MPVDPRQWQEVKKIASDVSASGPEELDEFEEEIATALANGEGGRIGELVERHLGSRARGFIQRKLSDDRCDADAEDIWSETRERVLRNYRSFEGRSRFSSWVMGVAAQVVREPGRKINTRTRHHQTGDFHTAGWLSGRITGPFTHAVRMEQARRWASLSEFQRDALHLYLEGYSWREVAEALRVYDDSSESVRPRAPSTWARWVERTAKAGIADLLGATT